MYPFLNNNFSFLYDYVYEQERMTMNYGYLPTFPPNIPPETQIDPSRVEHQAEEKKPQLIKTTYEEAVPQKCQRTQQCGMVKMEEKEKGVEQMIKMQQVSELPMKIKKNRNKNQYDKNMIGNIANIVLKEVFNHHFEGYLVKSCHFFQVKPIEFFSYMKKMMINKNRLGTTELYRIFHENIQNKFHKVFAFFMIKFIKEDYTTYILREGKMINRIKYIECASKILYIPKLTKEEYAFLHTLIK